MSDLSTEQIVPRQNPSAAVMVRPLHFTANAETAQDNFYQTESASDDAKNALAEFDNMISVLTNAGVEIIQYDEPRADVPDAVFPNNWFTTHPDGSLITYPMYALSRRKERRQDIINDLAMRYPIARRIDLTAKELSGAYLEGTGAIVFDHTQGIAFMAKSKRASPELLGPLCTTLCYRPVVFDAVDADNNPIYHTNVLLSIGENIALLGIETIADPKMRVALIGKIRTKNRLLVALTQAQIAEFAANALEIDTPNGPVLVMSERARYALSHAQRRAIETRVKLVAIPLPTIEKSGGSARCMMAGVHLGPVT